MATQTRMTQADLDAIVVQEIEDGDFTVVKGGQVYRGRSTQATPDYVVAGQTVSASDICEWIENDVLVKRSEG